MNLNRLHWKHAALSLLLSLTTLISVSQRINDKMGENVKNSKPGDKGPKGALAEVIRNVLKHLGD